MFNYSVNHGNHIGNETYLHMTVVVLSCWRETQKNLRFLYDYHATVSTQPGAIFKLVSLQCNGEIYISLTLYLQDLPKQNSK